MKSYKDLIVWQKSVNLCVEIYKATEKFPKSEIYGLSSQMRRSSVAIPSNIAEGQRRGYTNEYIQFLRIAFSSGAELETQLTIALQVEYLKKSSFNDLNSKLEEIMKMLNKLIQVLLHPTH
ncbi:four helix bundle protein [Candidatus Gottesmanbacteria bacterium]|nr:four helix bundle protein [Candidatus Gottesmanbacteria bacterium]